MKLPRWVLVNRDRAIRTSRYLSERGGWTTVMRAGVLCLQRRHWLGHGRVCENICVCGLWKKGFNSKSSTIQPSLALVLHVFKISYQNLWKAMYQVWSTGLEWDLRKELIFRFIQFRISIHKYVQFATFLWEPHFWQRKCNVPLQCDIT